MEHETTITVRLSYALKAAVRQAAQLVGNDLSYIVRQCLTSAYHVNDVRQKLVTDVNVRQNDELTVRQNTVDEVAVLQCVIDYVKRGPNVLQPKNPMDMTDEEFAVWKAENVK